MTNWQPDEDEPLADYALATDMAKPEVVVVLADPALREACLGGCGLMVGRGMKCFDCASAAVYDYYARVRAEAVARHSATIAARTKKRAPGGRRRR